MKKAPILALLASVVNATGLQVLTPAALKEKFGDDGIIQSHLGSKGHINYGHSFVSRLYYPKNNRNGCSPFVKSDVEDFEKDKSSVILDHGGCTHVEKTKNAQDFGFQAAILIEDDAIDFYALRKSFGEERNKIQRTGFELKIPYFKIFGSSGNSIVK